MSSISASTAAKQTYMERGTPEPSHLSASRLRRPALPSDAIPRPHLVQRLNAHDSGLTLVSAPAGFGKTTLVSEWLAGMDNSPAAWLSLERGDNDTGRFWRYAVTALQAIDPAIGLRLADMLRRPPLPPAEVWLDVLLEDLAGAASPVALVLDDYHVIHNRAIHKSLNYLLQHWPAGARMVLITRADPPLPLARLRVHDQLLEVRASDLLFTPAEIAHYVNKNNGAGLSADDLQRIARRTEGWPVGVHLAARSLQGCDADRRSDLIRTFSGSNRFVFSFLLEEVLQQQPAEVGEFLTRTSILPRFSAPLCAAVAGITADEAGRILARLAQGNLFVAPLDDDGCWYRYHTLFAEAMEAELRGNDADLWRELHRRAAVWCADNDHSEWAIEHALVAGDFETAADHIERVGDAMWATKDAVQLLRWLEALPERLIESRDGLRLLHVWLLVLNHRRPEAIALQEKAALAPPDTGGLRGRWAAIGGALCEIQGKPVEAIRLSRAALDHLPETDGLWRAVAQLHLGLSCQALGNVKPAAETYRQMIDMCLGRGFLFPAVTATALLIDTCHAQGRLYEAQALSERMQAMENLPGGAELCPRAGGQILLGRLAYERNDLAGAEAAICGAIGRLCSGAQSRLGVSGFVVLSLIAQASGETAAARRYLESALDLVAYAWPDADDRPVRAHLARLALHEGRWNDVRCWQATAGISPDDLPYPRREFEQRVLAEILLAEGENRQAEALLARLRAAAERSGRAGSELPITLLYAVALARQQRFAEAEAAVRRVLPLAQSQGYARTFLDAGPQIAGLLRRPGLRQFAPAYVERLLQAFDAEGGHYGARPGNGAHPPGEIDEALLDHLTPREWEILSMIARGASNQEIADRLVLSVGTVKGHVNHIFSKLDVHNRTAAVARARDFQLIES